MSTAHTTPAYRPHADSLPAQIIGFFKFNPEEHLTLDDITEKFTVTRGNIHSLLRLAIDSKMLERAKNEEEEYIYKAGPQINDCFPRSPAGAASEPAAYATIANARAATPTPTPKATAPAAPTIASGFSNVRKMIDFDALVVEQGVPFNTPQGSNGQSKWEPLFSKLSAVGTSTKVPVDVKGALAAAVLVRNKRPDGIKFKVAKISETEARIWRLA